MLDDAVIEQSLDRGELRFAGNVSVYAMQLPKPDLLDAKLAAAPDRLLAQILWIAVRLPHARAWTPEACLGRDQNAVIGIERLADQLFRHIRAVGVGGVDEVDAELGHALQRPERLRSVFRRPPYAFAGDAHGAEAETMNFGIAADLECAQFPSVELSHGGDSFKLARPPQSVERVASSQGSSLHPVAAG
jgi:hypothetical protein